ncbi:MAG: hypothetical protein K6L73_01305 [Cellvibrionaceae bacterium]
MSDCGRKVLLISYHFYPDAAVGARRPTEFAKSLSDNGFDVDVLTAKRELLDKPGYVNSIFSVREYPDPVNVLWCLVKKIRNVFRQGGGGQVSVKKTVNQMTETEKSTLAVKNENFSKKLKRYVLSYQALMSAQKTWVLSCVFYLLWLKLIGKRYDIVLSSSPPASVNFIALLAKKIFNAKWICDLRDPIIQWEDIYPECISGFRVSIEESLEMQYLKSSSNVLVTTPSFYAEVSKKLTRQSFDVERVAVLYNGYDVEPLESNNNLCSDKVFRIVHAGTLYMNRDPIPFFLAIKKLIDLSIFERKELVVEFYGDCQLWNGIDLSEWLKSENLNDVIQLKGVIKGDLLPKIYCSADLLLAFAQGQPKQIPAKIFEYIPYSGRILAITEKESDTATLLGEYQLGLQADNLEESIVGAIRTIIDEGRQSMSERKSLFSREKQNLKLIELCCD